MKKTLLATLIAGTVLVAGQASAGILDFDQRSGFDDDSFVEGNPIGLGVPDANFDNDFTNPTGAGYVPDTFSDLSWTFGDNGESDGTSSLNVTTYHSGGASTFAEGGQSPTAVGDANGMWDPNEYWTITRLTQENQVIAGYGEPLWTVNVDSLTKILQGAAELFDQPTSDAFSFFETNNDPSGNPGGLCDPSIADASGLGGECPDYYMALESILDSVGPFPGTDGHFYALDFRLVAVENATIADFGDGGSFDVITPEIANNISIVDIQAQYRKIPVPGTLALLGLGLAGLGFRNRRKNG